MKEEGFLPGVVVFDSLGVVKKLKCNSTDKSEIEVFSFELLDFMFSSLLANMAALPIIPRRGLLVLPNVVCCGLCVITFKK